MKKALFYLLLLIPFTCQAQTRISSDTVAIQYLKGLSARLIQVPDTFVFADGTHQSTGLTSSRLGNWNTAYNLSHWHGNKAVLDNITASGTGSKFICDAGTYEPIDTAGLHDEVSLKANKSDTSLYLETKYQINQDTSKLHNEIATVSQGLTLKAPVASPVFTGTPTIPTSWYLGATLVTITGVQLNYISGVNGVTGSDSLVLSYSPKLTGTLNGTRANFSGLVKINNDSVMTAALWRSGTYGSRGAAGGSMVYPSSGIPLSTGSAWGTSYRERKRGPKCFSLFNRKRNNNSSDRNRIAYL